MEMLLEPIRLRFQTKRKGNIYIASCYAFDIHTKGYTEREATQNLIIAVKSFINICLEMGTLDEILEECGLKPVKTAAESLQIHRFLMGPIPFSQN